MNEILFSIVVPAFNVENYIERTCLSLQKQTYHEFEAIIIDDGSSDGTRKIAERITSADSRFSLISQENKGLSTTRNIGASTAKGHYIYFLDGDDELESNALERMKHWIDLHNLPDALFFDATIIDESGTRSTDLRYVRNKLPGSQSGALTLLTPSNETIVSSCCYVARSTLVRQLRFEPGIYFEDNLYFCDLILSCETAVVAPEALFLRRIRPSSITSSRTNNRHIDSMLVVALGLAARAFNQRNHASRIAIADFAARMYAEAVTLFFRATPADRGEGSRLRLFCAFFFCRTILRSRRPPVRQLFRLMFRW